MGSYLSSEPQPPAERAALAKEIHTLVAEKPVVMFSKTWCGFCSQAKSLFMKMAVTPRVVELNQRDDGSHMQRMTSSTPKRTRSTTSSTTSSTTNTAASSMRRSLERLNTHGRNIFI